MSDNTSATICVSLLILCLFGSCTTIEWFRADACEKRGVGCECKQ